MLDRIFSCSVGKTERPDKSEEFISDKSSVLDQGIS